METMELSWSMKLKDWMAPRHKRLIKKLLLRHPPKRSVVLKDAAWLGAYAKRFTEKTELKYTQRIDTNINTDLSLSVDSRSRDEMIEKLLRSKRYTFKDILVIQNPFRYAPLTAIAVFYTRKPCAVRVITYSQAKVRKYIGTCPFGKFHRIPILGLYAGVKTKVKLECLDEENKVIESRTIQLGTKPLPKSLRKMVSVKKRVAGGTLKRTLVFGGDTQYPYIFDEKGKIRFYYKRTPKAYGLYPISGGRYLFAEKNVLRASYSNPHSTQMNEIDLLGRIHATLNVKNGMHHDAGEMVPGGNFIAASSSLIHYNEDAIIEIDRVTGHVVKQVNLDQVILDDTYKDTVDWAHINTVSYDANTNCVLACLRNLHSVVLIDWETEKLVWILGDPKFWKGTKVYDYVLQPTKEDMPYFYQAHAAYFIESKDEEMKLIIFDNHWCKRRPVENYDEDPNSYGRIYRIHPKTHTVELLDSFESIKSKIRSNAIYAPEANRVYVMSGYLEPAREDYNGMLYEYDLQSHELIIQYSTVNTFYRAYPVTIDYEELSKPIDQNRAIFYGEIDEPQPMGELLVEGSEDIILEKIRKDKKEYTRIKQRKEERIREFHETGLKKELKQKKKKAIDHIRFKVKEDILYMYSMDHIVANLYFVSEDQNYVMNYTDTVQCTPSLFAETYYYTAISLANLKKGNYELYFESHKRLYHTEYWIQIKK